MLKYLVIGLLIKFKLRIQSRERMRPVVRTHEANAGGRVGCTRARSAAQGAAAGGAGGHGEHWSRARGGDASSGISGGRGAGRRGRRSLCVSAEATP